jgi:hypothetical protein
VCPSLAGAAEKKASTARKQWKSGRTLVTHAEIVEDNHRVGWTRTHSRGPARPGKTFGSYQGQRFKGVHIATDDASVERRTFRDGRTTQETSGDATGLLQILDKKR